MLSIMRVMALSCLGISSQIADTQVSSDFEARRASMPQEECFAIFDTEMTDEARQAMQFLYAYMPLPDVTDYPADYFLENVSVALRTRTEMPWGSTVPDREFRHFVLPVRVNNENLDFHRPMLYEQLRDRVKGMTMQDAILEVNHWCHEYVSYQPSDSRTHSPLASMSSHIGRCGEESTFTVAALRAIGIPARQVYTPRWAHTDDNHAWVEAWADGKWYFLGACEPEPVLNLGWFNAPASRGMLMNTRTLGRYDGPEERLLEMPMYTDINVTDNYAHVDTVTVIVVDDKGAPVADAQIDFRLYNYAEYYPIASKKADANGKASLVAGDGTLVVWVSAGGAYNYQPVMVGRDRNVTIALTTPPNGTVDIDIVPPTGGNTLPQVSEALTAANDRRKAYEDSVRNAAIAGFMTQQQSDNMARRLGIRPERLWPIMQAARGNYAELASFIMAYNGKERQRALLLLENLSPKDLTDVNASVLYDAMTSAPSESPLYGQYVLSPRILNEFLTPHRQELAALLSPEQAEAFATDPQALASWIANTVSTDERWMPSTVHMDPLSVLRLKKSDTASRDIAFVAVARAIGIPARIDPVTEKPQYADSNQQWIDALPLISADKPASKGQLMLTYAGSDIVPDPGYYTHFTLSQIVEGVPQLLNFPEDGTVASIFAEPVTLDAGTYILVSGQRLANGNVLSRMLTFEIQPGQTTTLPLTLRDDTDDIKVIGNFNSENLYYDLDAHAAKSLLSTTGRGYYVVGVVNTHHEPSEHALRDISAMAKELEATGTPIVILLPDTEGATAVSVPLPATTHIGADIDGTIARELTQALSLAEGDMPIFVVADTFNRVVFVSHGYTIGLGHQLLNTLSKIK